MNGILERVGRTRPDIPWTEDALDPELVELVRSFHRDNRPKLYALFAKYPEKRALVFRTRGEAERWLIDLKGRDPR